MLDRGGPLEAFAGGDAEVGDVHEGDAGFDGAVHGAHQGFGGDTGVGEVSVEEAGGAGYLVEGEAATVPGEGIHCFEDLEPERDQLFEAPPDLVAGEVHGLVETRYLR